MGAHQCKSDELVWAKEPVSDGDALCWEGVCPVCGKVYQQVYTASDGLWDEAKQETVYLR